MKQFSRGRLIRVLSLAATCVAGPVLAADAAAGPPKRSVSAVAALKAKQGAERVFRITSRGTSHIDLGLMTAGVSRAIGQDRARNQGAASLQTIQYDLAADFHARVVSVDPQGWTESARLQQVVYTVDGSTDARRDVLSTPFLIRYDRAGRMVAFTFPRHFPTALKSVIQRMVEPLQVVTGAAGETSWSANEQESDTAYTARYQVTSDTAGGLTLSKHKTQVQPVALEKANLPLPGVPAAKINRSEAVLEFDPVTGALVRVSSGESVTTTWGTAFFSDYDTTYQATLVPGGVAPLARTLAEAQVALADPKFALARLYDVDPQTLKLVEGRDLPAVMADYRGAIVDQMGLGTRLLKAWLRLHPEKSLEVARQIDAFDPKLQEHAFEFGWASLASAGHPEAQRALLQVMTTPGWKPQSKHKAMIAMMSLEAPDAALARAVWAEHAAIVARGAGTGMQASIITNVYGAMGDVEKGNPALTAEVVNNLAGLLAKSDVRSKVLALDALSNVGELAKVGPLAAPYLVGARPEVRVAAFSTFRRMGGEGTFQRFAAAFAVEKDSDVRVEAMKVAKVMPPSAARNAWATARIAQETDPKVQSEFVQILGRGLAQYPQNAATLQGLLKSVHDRAVRRDIYAFAAPAVKGGTP